jgi:hypothetical protein
MTHDTPRAALAAALAPWLAEYKAGIIGTFSQGSPRWDERTPEDRESWMPGATDEAEHYAVAILAALDGWTLVPSDDLLMVKAQEAAHGAEIERLRAALDAHHRGRNPDYLCVKCAVLAPSEP